MKAKVGISDNVGVIITERPKKDKKEQVKSDADSREAHVKDIRPKE